MFTDDVDSSSASYHLVVDVNLAMIDLTALHLMIDGLHEGVALTRRIDDDREGEDDVFVLLGRRGDRWDESRARSDLLLYVHTRHYRRSRAPLLLHRHYWRARHHSVGPEAIILCLRRLLRVLKDNRLLYLTCRPCVHTTKAPQRLLELGLPSPQLLLELGDAIPLSRTTRRRAGAIALASLLPSPSGRFILRHGDGRVILELRTFVSPGGGGDGNDGGGGGEGRGENYLVGVRRGRCDGGLARTGGRSRGRLGRRCAAALACAAEGDRRGDYRLHGFDQVFVARRLFVLGRTLGSKWGRDECKVSAMDPPSWMDGLESERDRILSTPT
mmetsp:Transcript_12659/g.29055  ORF Transcript_12659/g.29055 Transcript_12659/m.29055 type:complete len:329 (+) Transcript_12659:491-1477(+)